MSDSRRGALQAASAFAMWGFLPIYLRLLERVPPMEVLIHRIVWLSVFLVALLRLRGGFGIVLSAFRSRSLVVRFVSSAALLSINWFLYIWSVNAHRVVDASLGYFINPLVNVLLGVVVLRERLRRLQWTSIALAAGGVVWLTIVGRHLPWIGLSLALTFGTYGLLRKTAALGALDGLAVETLLLLPPALLYLGSLLREGQSAFAAGGPGLRVLLVAAGPITGVPLLLFAAGARQIPLSLLGLLQYIGPTIQLLLGLFLWHEPFVFEKFVGYAIIWAALALYTGEGYWTLRAAQLATAKDRPHMTG